MIILSMALNTGTVLPLTIKEIRIPTASNNLTSHHWDIQLMESHTVSVIPGVLPQNYNDAAYDPVLNPDGSIPPVGGVCQGVVKLDIVKPELITGDEYLITFVDSILEISRSRYELCVWVLISTGSLPTTGDTLYFSIIIYSQTKQKTTCLLQTDSG